MNLKKKLIPVLIAPLIAGLTFSSQALANDSDELEKLRQLVQELDQKVKILDRKSELAEEAAAEKRKVTPIVQTEDGFGFKSGDGKNEIKLQGRVQADYHDFPGTRDANANTTEVRRAYLTLAGKVYKDYDFKVTGNFADQKADTSIKTTTGFNTSLKRTRSRFFTARDLLTPKWRADTPSRCLQRSLKKSSLPSTSSSQRAPRPERCHKLLLMKRMFSQTMVL